MSFPEGCGREWKGEKVVLSHRSLTEVPQRPVPQKSGALPRRYTLVKCVCVWGGGIFEKERGQRIVLVLSLAAQKMEMLG